MNSFIKLFILISVIFFASCATNEVIKDPDQSDNEKAPETPKQFTRIFFDYEEMGQMPVMELDPEIVQIIDSAYDEITMNNSTRALATVENLYRNQEAHPDITDVYAYCLFRNGHRFKALEIIDDAIKQFGPYGNLIYSRIIMSMELAETGLNMMQVDGNGIYNSSDLLYDEADFIKTNYQSALHDALYLFSQFDTEANLAFQIALIFRELEEYEKSNQYFLLYVDLCADIDAGNYHIAKNYIEMKRYGEAEVLLLNLYDKFPASPEIIGLLGYIYEETGDDAKLEEWGNKYRFFNLIPDFMELEFDNAFLETIDFFNSEIDPEEKYIKYQDMFTNANDEFINISAIILYNHQNHGNGLEELIVEKLVELGDESIPVVLNLFQTPGISTCTITKCCEIFVALKSEPGWNAMLEFLPNMAQLPSTLIPPSVPENLIAFNEREGAKAIIENIKTFILADELADDEGDFSLMNFSFGKARLYTALEKLPEATIIEIANECNYSEQELELLLKEVYE